MTGKETEKVVNFVIATWNMRMTAEVHEQMYVSWHRYLGMFEYDEVMQAVDRHAVSSKWAPKPAELWQALAAPNIPSVEIAYQQAVKLRESLAYGTPRPETSTMATLTSMRFSGKMSERAFGAVYEEITSKYLLELFDDLRAAHGG